MSKVGTTWLPFFKGNSVDENIQAALTSLNELATENDLQVINVETVYGKDWLGRPVEPCGLRAWWVGVPPLTVAESVQVLFDQVSS